MPDNDCMYRIMCGSDDDVAGKGRGNAKAKFALDGAHCPNGLILLHLCTPQVRHEAEFYGSKVIILIFVYRGCVSKLYGCCVSCVSSLMVH